MTQSYLIVSIVSYFSKISKKRLETYFAILTSLGYDKQDEVNIDKILNSFANNPQTRITWINEIKDVKIDETLFKKFCEGKLQTTKLYEEESHDIIHNSKAFITANTMIGYDRH
jgi:CRISPR/Cas system CMR-associated protein Cmr5 small subunit